MIVHMLSCLYVLFLFADMYHTLGPPTFVAPKLNELLHAYEVYDDQYRIHLRIVDHDYSINKLYCEENGRLFKVWISVEKRHE